MIGVKLSLVRSGSARLDRLRAPSGRRLLACTVHLSYATVAPTTLRARHYRQEISNDREPAWLAAMDLCSGDVRIDWRVDVCGSAGHHDGLSDRLVSAGRAER